MKTESVEAEKKANAILAWAGRRWIGRVCHAFLAGSGLFLMMFLLSGCEMMQEVFVAPSNTATNYSKGTGEIASVTSPAPGPKKQAEFDAMMERLENRSPAPTITPRSEPVAAAVTSPKATASAPMPAPAPAPTRVAAATPPPPQAEPLIIKAPPPSPPRAGASQLLATNPPPKPAETAVVAPVPPRPVQSLVVVGTHKPPPKNYGGWKTLLLITLVLLLAASFLLSFAPVRERLLTWKVAATVWWSTRKIEDKPKSPSKGSHQTARPAWVQTVSALAKQAIFWVKTWPVFTRSTSMPETAALSDPHRPTPAEMLLKKIGAPPGDDVSTSRSNKPHKPGETSALPVITTQPTAEKAESKSALPASVSSQSQPAPVAPTAASVTPSADKAPVSPEQKPDQSRVNKVLQAPFTPAIITLMSPPPERPVASAANSKPADPATGQAKPSTTSDAEKKQNDARPAGSTTAPATSSAETKGDAKPTQISPRDAQPSQKVDEPVTA